MPANSALAGLSSAYFGMVMATGIMSLGAYFLRLPTIADLLFTLNIGIYGVLWALFLLRAWRHPWQFFGDMVNHSRGPGFFTMVAGSGILGSQALVLHNNYSWAWGLWGMAVTLWLVLTYAVFAALTIKASKPTLDQGINGGWLLAVVATQSIAVLSALLARKPGPYTEALNFFALSMWLWGGMLYIWIMSLIFYRYTFFRLAPADLTSPYWINMGAMAISTLVGSLLIQNATDSSYLLSLLPFLKGFTVFYWATGTWWIPMLLVLGVWRYVYKRYPLRYEPLYWGAVFPLGMYAACTYQMAGVMSLDFLAWLPPLFFAIGLAAWGACCLGLLVQLWGRVAGFVRY